MKFDAYLEKHFQILFFLILAAGTLFSIYYSGNQLLDGDQDQMLLKGYMGAYAGNWLPFGNYGSTVGNVPGYLSALVVGGPLLLWDSPWAPMAFLIAIRIASVFILDAVLKHYFSKPVRLVFVLLVWFSPWMQYDNVLYNPSYLLFFAALHFWTAFKMREGVSFGYSFLHVLSIGMAMQLHFSWPLLAFVSFYLLYRGLGKVSWIGVICGILVTGASLIPYFIEMMNNDQIVQESDRYIGYGLTHVYPVLKSVLYWIRYGSMMFSNKAIANSTFEWITTIEFARLALVYIWKAWVFGVGAFTVVVSARYSWRFWKHVKPMIRKSEGVATKEDWLPLYAFGVFVAILICAALAPITFNYWHLMLAYPFAIIPILYGVKQFLESKPERFKLFFLIAVCHLVLVNIVASNDSRKYSSSASYVEQVNKFVKDHHSVIYKKSEN
ncbi:3-deoxy-D-manno-octulosonic acid transferase [Vibrio penaeicida]|uniref:3-deoxy-D-manno-octulosonic acid transferase n=1 Tax=Vibrio penaeicida TaxID=104609 RepID=UPI002734E340|nr:3-deoxy-D-manno-octulosonic acid transferase [Vibrio penaeicida]MDP2575404.1 3-deoxy-D-manno-octulosonic acid transferase [Vibrio penaeicida]